MARLMETRTALKLGLMPTVFATVAALYFAQAVLVPLAMAILLAFLLAPVVNWLERWSKTRFSATCVEGGGREVSLYEEKTSGRIAYFCVGIVVLAALFAVA